jgi:hypothetical protein
VTSGFSHDLLLICASGDKRVVQGLANQLKSEGLQPKVQTVKPLTITSPLEQAPLVLLVVSSTLQTPLAEVLAGGIEVLPPGRLLLLQLDDGEIEGLSAAVEVIAWPRQLKGEAKKTRQTSLARIRELAGAISPTAQMNRVTEAAPTSAPGQGNSSGSKRDNFNKEIRLALSRRAVTARKDDAPAAHQAALAKVADRGAFSSGGGLIHTTSG